MKPLLLTAIALCLMACEQEINETFNNPQRFKTLEVDSCEYLLYDAEMLCGHQYTHHTYNARLLTHKGNCKYCKQRRKR